MIFSERLERRSLVLPFILSNKTRLIAITITFDPPSVYLASSPVIATGLCWPSQAAGWNSLNSCHRFQNCFLTVWSIWNRLFSPSQLSNSWGKITGTRMVDLCDGRSRSLHGISTIHGSLDFQKPKPPQQYPWSYRYGIIYRHRLMYICICVYWSLWSEGQCINIEHVHSVSLKHRINKNAVQPNQRFDRQSNGVEKVSLTVVWMSPIITDFCYGFRGWGACPPALLYHSQCSCLHVSTVRGPAA